MIDLLMRRREMAVIPKSILPQGYTRLKYIYTDNNAYINTGIAIGSSDEIYSSWINVARGSSDKCIWGARDTSALYSFVDAYNTGNLTYYRWGGKASGSINSNSARVVDGVFYIYRDGNLVFTWDSQAGTFQMTTPITLFAYNDTVQNTVRMFLKGVGIKEFVIKNKFNAIPCIDPNNVVGMYNLVNESFYGSENSTPFIAGTVYGET